MAPLLKDRPYDPIRYDWDYGTRRNLLQGITYKGYYRPRTRKNYLPPVPGALRGKDLKLQRQEQLELELEHVWKQFSSIDLFEAALESKVRLSERQKKITGIQEDELELQSFRYLDLKKFGAKLPWTELTRPEGHLIVRNEHWERIQEMARPQTNHLLEAGMLNSMEDVLNTVWLLAVGRGDRDVFLYRNGKDITIFEHETRSFFVLELEGEHFHEHRRFDLALGERFPSLYDYKTLVIQDFGTMYGEFSMFPLGVGVWNARWLMSIRPVNLRDGEEFWVEVLREQEKRILSLNDLLYSEFREQAFLLGFTDPDVRLTWSFTGPDLLQLSTFALTDAELQELGLDALQNPKLRWPRTRLDLLKTAKLLPESKRKVLEDYLRAGVGAPDVIEIQEAVAYGRGRRNYREEHAVIWDNLPDSIVKAANPDILLEVNDTWIWNVTGIGLDGMQYTRYMWPALRLAAHLWTRDKDGTANGIYDRVMRRRVGLGSGRPDMKERLWVEDLVRVLSYFFTPAHYSPSVGYFLWGLIGLGRYMPASRRRSLKDFMAAYMVAILICDPKKLTRYRP